MPVWSSAVSLRSFRQELTRCQICCQFTHCTKSSTAAIGGSQLPRRKRRHDFIAVAVALH